jgi:hypothetical protein
MDAFALIAERRILEAMENGAFDDLPGKGRPIPRDEETDGVPEELRMAYKILRNAGYLPQELELRRERLALEDLLRTCPDEAQREEVRRRLSHVSLHYEILAERNRTNPAFSRYRDRIAARLGF